MELTQKHIDSVRGAFLIMNAYAQEPKENKMSGCDPVQVIADVYYELAVGWFETLKELDAQ